MRSSKTDRARAATRFASARLLAGLLAIPAGGVLPGLPMPAAPAVQESARPAGAAIGAGAAEDAGAAKAAASLRFTDVARQAGIDATIFCGGTSKDHILESAGSGVALVDLDDDSRLDLYLVNAWALDEDPSRVRERGRNRLYHNRGDGTFVDVTEHAGVGDDGWGCGVSAGDADGDGQVDLYVTNFGPNRLYRNRGDGTFTEIAARAGVAEPGWSVGSAFLDADGDGDFDLYVANYIDCTLEEVLAARRTGRWRGKAHVMAGPFGMRGGRDRFFRNRGDGTFVDATAQAGMTDEAESYGMGVLASDLDGDGDVDVYVANDSNPNYLYRNEGDGTFQEVALWSGAALGADGSAQAGMGVDAADLDGDNLPEILVTHFARDSCTLYHNTGNLFFEDVSAKAKLRRFTFDPLSWGCAFLDADRDADLDLVIVNGHIYPQVDTHPEFGESYRQLPLLLQNDEGRWVDASRNAGPGFQIAVSGRGLATGDWDADGDLDLVVTTIDAPPLLLRNDTEAPGHWLELRLLDERGAPALHARATITAGGLEQMREVRSGSTYASQSAFDLHFGLGAAERVTRLEVRWPGGAVTVLENLPVDRLHVLHAPQKGTPGGSASGGSTEGGARGTGDGGAEGGVKASPPTGGGAARRIRSDGSSSSVPARPRRES